MPLWIPIAFIAVILWVLGNLIDKYLLEKFRNEEDNEADANTLFLFSAFFAVPVAGVAYAMGAHVTIAWSAFIGGIGVGVLNGVYLLLYLHAAARAEISRIVPIFQLVPVFTALLGWYFLHEILTSFQIIAGLLVLSGATILSYQRTKTKFQFEPVLMMLFACAAIASQLTLFKITTLATTYWTGVFWSAVGLALFGLLVYISSTRSRRHWNSIFIKKEYRIFVLNIGNEVLDSAAYLTFLFATTLGPIALVQTANAYQPVLLLVFAAVATKLGFDHVAEDISRETLIQKIFGIVLIGIGSACIYVPLIVGN